ncbi:fructosamine kinase family protein [Ruania halotolerans]|uniref:fructosamine kinase family protein n=1 Tax=Ruania halotolerans TaxID=2897773 RepID=UPI001E630B0E|nr:fructosamine kinase family protein [Ruania halotolerans]UFU06339.1 fructosamine kinase family protein [Ruania halotolerans]
MRNWRKTDFPHPDAALAEADGLRWLAEADGGARVAQVRHVEAGVLDLEHVATGRGTPAMARAFGAALARTHAAGAPSFGYVPGSTGGFMAGAPMPGSDAATWGEFYADARVLPFVRRAEADGAFSERELGVFTELADRLRSGQFDHEQPGLLRDGGVAVARLHGDLWSGNVLWGAGDTGGEVVLIDATAHGGHAETDLAMLDLFGAPHLEEILAGYQEVSSLAEGWQDRVALHQVNPLLVHTVLFGGGYAQAAVAAAARYL